MIVLAIIALAVGCLLDVVSSRQARDAGAVEANPLLRAAGPAWVWVRVGVTVGCIALVAAAPGLWWAGLAVGAAWCLVALRNWTVAGRLK